MYPLDVVNSTRANVGPRFLVPPNIDAILAEAKIHKTSAPIVLINSADHRSRGQREVIRKW